MVIVSGQSGTNVQIGYNSGSSEDFMSHGVDYTGGYPSTINVNPWAWLGNDCCIRCGVVPMPVGGLGMFVQLRRFLDQFFPGKALAKELMR